METHLDMDLIRCYTSQKKRRVCEYKRLGVVLRSFLLLKRDLLWDGPRPEEDGNRIGERCQWLWQFSRRLRHPDCA